MHSQGDAQPVAQREIEPPRRMNHFCRHTCVQRIGGYHANSEIEDSLISDFGIEPAPLGLTENFRQRDCRNHRVRKFHHHRIGATFAQKYRKNGRAIENNHSPNFLSSSANSRRASSRFSARYCSTE